MKTYFYSCIVSLVLLFPLFTYSQAPTLGSTQNFAVFTAAGSFTNDGATVIMGDVGTHVGAFSGFPPGVVLGNIYIADGVSAQAAIDVNLAYSELDGLPCGTVLGVNLGGGQILAPGIYCIGAATVLNGTLVLDGQGDPNARFIFQIDGALSTSTFADIVLINGASSCNVYWQVNGAFSLGGFSVFLGTLIADGAITLLEGSSLEGRALSVGGAIDLHTNLVSLSLPPTPSFIAASGSLTFCEGDSVILSGNVGGIWSNGDTTFSITVLESGIYFVDNSNDCGPAVSNELVVMVIIDITPPEITCAIDVTVECSDNLLPINTGISTAIDDCDLGPLISYTDISVPGLCLGSFVLLRTWVAVDITGNSAVCTQTITVTDVTAPEIVCPLDVVLSCTDLINPDSIGFAIGTDNCDLVPVISFVDVTITGSCADSYTIIRTWLALDNCGNEATCDQNIVVLDSIAPLITCPIDISISCELSILPDNTGFALAVDNCDVLPVISYTDVLTPSAECPQNYLITRIWTAIDACDNLSSCLQVILVSDAIAPVILCPVDISIDCSSSILPEITGFATVLDNCDMNPIIDFSDVTLAGSCPEALAVVRTWTSTDACGNVSVCVQSIMLVDGIIPVITCPLDLSISCALEVPLPDIDLVIASDNCGIPLVSFAGDVVTSQTCLDGYTILRTYMATDICESTAICVQLIVVNDIESPILTCPLDVLVDCEDLVPVIDVSGVVVSDNCGSLPTVFHLGDVISDVVCLNQFLLTRTYQSIDTCGNIGFCTQLITVLDNVVPTITCLTDVTVSCAEDVPLVDVSLIISEDNCGGDMVVSLSLEVITDQICENNFILSRTFEAVDDCGNIGVCTQLITVLDNIAPTLTCPAGVLVACAGDVPLVDISLVLSEDNCGGVIVVSLVGEVIGNQTCVNDFVLLRTYQAVDDCGNIGVCTQVITVLDSLPPVITCPLAITVGCADLIPSLDSLQLVVIDNCGPSVVTISEEVISNETCENGFVVSRTYLATDDCGNTATCIQMITVLDTVPPVIVFINPLLSGLISGDTIEVQCYGQDPLWDLPDFSVTSISALDTCLGEVSVDFQRQLIAEGNCTVDGYIQLFRLTWTATDICGNFSTAFIMLQLVDTIPPVIIGIPADVSLDCADLLQAPVNITALDECLCACVVVSEQSEPQPGCQDGMEITITWTATDRCGNVTNETQLITLIDTIAPTIEMVHPDIAGMENGTILEVECHEDGFPRFVHEMNNESVFSPDVCGGSVQVVLDTTMTVSTNCSIDGYLEERTFLWTVTDLCGNSSTFSFSVRMIDTISPVWVGVPDTVCMGSPLLTGIQASDNCLNPYTKIIDRSIPNPCGSGMATQRRYQATDECGNTAVSYAMILPGNQTIPVILFVNSDLEDLSTNESLILHCSAVNGHFTSFGEDDVYLDGICSVIASTTFTEEIIETRNCTIDSVKAIVALIWTVTDVCGNSASRSIIATIVDDTPPVFVNFQPELTVSCASALPVILATDECGEVIITSIDSIVASNCVFEYDLYRKVTATDGCGNSITEQQIIHVGSGTGPIMSEIDTVICDNLDIPIVTAYDPCLEEFIKVTMKVDTLDNLCTGGLVIVRTWTAKDTCGRESVVTQTIVLNDHTAPTISVPDSFELFPFWNNPNSTVNLWQFELVELLYSWDANSVVVSDDCHQSIIPVFTVDVVLSEDCEEDGYYERRIFTWIATDVCGNADTLTVNVDIIDDVPPVYLDFPYDITLHCVPLPAVPSLTVYDYAPFVSIDFTEITEPGLEPGVQIVTRAWVATDVCGNSTRQEQSITLIPDNNLACEILLSEGIECNSHGVLVQSNITGGSGILSYRWTVEGDKCFIQSGQGTPWINIYVGWSPVKIILEVTDSMGCVSICMIELNCISDELSSQGLINDGEIIHSMKPNLSNVFTNNDVPAISEVKAWPNPVSDEVNLSFMANEESRLEINLINLFGQRIQKETVTANVGMNSRRLNLAGVPDGNYVIQFVTKEHVSTINVVVLAK